ncbi:MAG TPA: hypothetical protein VFA70_14270 [Dehalococcoidia bacterium]|jgi:hypothetical protein|nr:hypothetical protein [Dehalococcoidia bacterium]
MSALPEVHDEQEAAELVRELFRSPSPAALALATPDDRSSHDAVLRYLKVALADLPPEQARLLLGGAACLLAEPELTGHLVGVLADEGQQDAGVQAAAAAAGGALRGVPVHGTGEGDLHALVLGLCARFGVAPPPEALARDTRDPRYRDLALVLLAAADAGTVAHALPEAAAACNPSDAYDVEALGRALEAVLARHGEGLVLAILRDAPAAARSALLAGLHEALEPERLASLTAVQQADAAAAFERRAAAEPENAYLRLRADPAARNSFLAAAEQVIETQREH